MDTITYGLLAFLLLTLWSRYVSTNALKNLPGEQKLIVFEAFSGMNRFSLVIGAVIIVA
jgi:hypothetical protein